MSKLSERRYVLGYVHIHSEEEARLFRKAMFDARIVYYDDWGEVTDRKMMCDNCGNEVREHEEDGTCP